MRLQFLSTLLAIGFLLPNVGYTEIQSTKNLALGYSFEEEIFVDESDVDEKVYYGKVEVGAEGNIYVKVNGADKVIVLTPNGQLVKKIDKIEAAEVKFDNIKEDFKEEYIPLLPDYVRENLKEWSGWTISDCEKDKDGNIYFCFLLPGRILKYNTQGEKIFEIFVFSSSEMFTGPVDLEIDDFGNIIVANATDSTLTVYDKNGRFLYSHAGSFLVEGADSDEGSGDVGSGLSDITIDGLGNVYAIDRWDNHIKKLTPIKKETVFQQAPEDEVRELIEKLKNGTKAEMNYAIRRLNRTTDPEAIKALISVFEHSEGYGPEALSLESIGKPAIPFLIEALKSPIGGIRIGVLGVLNSILELNSDQSVVIPILDFLRAGPLEDERGQSIWTRENEIAISILGKVRDRRSVPVLIDIMKNYPSYRLDVVTEVLVSIGDKSAIPGLIEVLKSEYGAHWSAIATLTKALGRLKAKEAVDVIVERGLKNQFLQVRESAAQALKEIGDPKAIPALQKALETADEDLKRVKNTISEAIRGLEELEEEKLEEKKEP